MCLTQVIFFFNAVGLGGTRQRRCCLMFSQTHPTHSPALEFVIKEILQVNKEHHNQSIGQVIRNKLGKKESSKESVSDTVMVVG